MKKRRIIILGAAGRDYFNFLTYYKDNPYYEVVAFTQTQIPDIEKRSFPKQLAGKLYKKNIPFYPEEKLSELIKKLDIDEVVLSYSDLSHEEVMHKASIALAAGASFRLLGPKDTMLKSKKPVIAVCAVRTGAGKSQTSRAIGKMLHEEGKKVAVARHPMPYGNLIKQEVQKFVSEEDFNKQHATIEEREEYEPWIKLGFSVYAGVDYKKILALAEKEADVVLFDGGNNDESFFKPDLLVVIADALRPNHEVTYYPGFVNLLMADVIIINKIREATPQAIKTIERNIRRYNPRAQVIKASSVITVDNPDLLKFKKALVIGDGPSLTHGNLLHGAGYYVLKEHNASIVDAEKYAVGSIKQVYRKYPRLKLELPAMGYSDKQIKELQATINRTKCDVVVDGSPANLGKIMKLNKPIVNVTYELDRKSILELKKIVQKRGFI